MVKFLRQCDGNIFVQGAPFRSRAFQWFRAPTPLQLNGFSQANHRGFSMVLKNSFYPYI